MCRLAKIRKSFSSLDLRQVFGKAKIFRERIARLHATCRIVWCRPVGSTASVGPNLFGRFGLLLCLVSMGKNMITKTWEDVSLCRALSRILMGDHPGEAYADEAVAYARVAFRRASLRDPDIISDFLSVWTAYAAARIASGQDFRGRAVRRSCLRDARRQTWRLRRAAMGQAAGTGEPLRRIPSYVDCLAPEPLRRLADERDGGPSSALWSAARGRVRRVSRTVDHTAVLVDGDGVVQAFSFGRRGY